jgi:hypothetical protein
MKKNEWGVPRAAGSKISGGIFGRNKMNALIGLVRSVAVRSAGSSIFSAAAFSGAALFRTRQWSYPKVMSSM